MTGNKNKTIPFQLRLENELKRMVDDGGFIAAALSDERGLILSTIGNRFLTDIISALSSLSLQFKTTVQVETDFDDIDEVSCVSGNKARYVNRFFKIGKDFYILSIIIPPYHSYRRFTNQSISKFKKIISDRLSQRIE